VPNNGRALGMMAEDNEVLSYSTPVASFRSRKAAQICAFFALRNGGTIEKLKLIKLIYFAEREFIKETSFPMLFDEFYSLYNGPICSSTLNGINGIVTPENEAFWGEYIARNGNIVVPIKAFSPDDLDELSAAEEETLQLVWTKLGHMTASQLRNYSHDYCPEYTQVDKGCRLPITYSEVVAALGSDAPHMVDEEIRGIRRAESILSGD
jgi:uncharacterized phage-associated protein